MSNQIYGQSGFENSIKFCPACGSEMPMGAKFCAICGCKSESRQQESRKQENFEEPKSSPQKEFKQKYPGKSPVYGDFGERAVAFIIDSIIISIIASILSGVFGLGFGFMSAGDSWKWILALPYFWISAYRGQSWGQMIMHLKVVDQESFQQLSEGQAFLHVVGKVFFLPLDIILNWFIDDKEADKREQCRISQRISKSVVIKSE